MLLVQFESHFLQYSVRTNGLTATVSFPPIPSYTLSLSALFPYFSHDKHTNACYAGYKSFGDNCRSSDVLTE